MNDNDISLKISSTYLILWLTLYSLVQWYIPCDPKMA